MMTRFCLNVSAAAWFALVASASANITIGPVRGQPGQSVRLVTFSESKGGTIQRSYLGTTTNGSIEIIRERDLVWTFRAPAEDGTRRGMVRVPKLTTTTTTVLDGKKDVKTDSSPLVGKMFAMSKSPAGDWKFELDGSLPLARVRSEIDELTVYLKRDWFPARELKVGDSWEFDPAWIRRTIERDVSKAQTIGTMKLRQVRNSQNRRLAVIDVSIQSTGSDFRPDGIEADGTVDLKGEVIVNLETMLDELLDLKGTITLTTIKGAETTRVNLPVRLLVTKSFVRDSAMR
ncbi:MAG: hypothetical protein ACRDBP_03720 [Luteolibacter sp.]